MGVALDILTFFLNADQINSNRKEFVKTVQMK